MALSTGVASAAPVAGPGPSCTLGPVTIQNDNATTQPASLQLIAQDPAGLKRQISPYHLNATRVLGAVSPGTTSPVTSTFTQADPNYASSASLQITDTANQKTVCLAQFKNVIPGGRAFTTGFAFPYDRNNLVIQNSAANGLTSAHIQINSSCQLDVTLTPGQLWSTDMSNVGGAGLNCLIGDGGPTDTTLNTVTVTAQGPAGATAEAVVWGVGPFIYGQLPE